MSEEKRGGERHPGSFEETREAQRRDVLRASPRQRLEWLEEVLELLRIAGIAPRRRGNDRR